MQSSVQWWWFWLVTLACVGCARAATWAVDTQTDTPDVLVGDTLCQSQAGGCSLRAAIQEANALPGFDQIDVPGGPYFLKLRNTLIEDASASGDLDIREPLRLRGIFNGQMAQIQDTFVLHTPEGERLFDVQTGDADVPVVFENLLLSFGKAHDALGGGAILVRAGSKAVIERCILYANGADSRGNALAVFGNAELQRSNVFDNHRAADSSTGIGGGGIYVAPQAELLVDRSAIGSNNHCRGGGILADGPSSVTIRRSSILDNQARNLAGCEDSDAHGDLLALRGAVQLTISDSTLGESPEHLHAVGGALVQLRHVTINGTSLQGGFALEGTGNTLSLANSIWSRRADTDFCSTPPGAVTSLGGNLFQHAPPCGIALQTSDQLTTDLRLQSVQLRDTSTGVSVEARRIFVPLADSPAIEAGLDAHCSGNDEIDNPRPQPGPAATAPIRCDAGAVEWPGLRLLVDGFE